LSGYNLIASLFNLNLDMLRTFFVPFALVICFFYTSCASPGGLFKSYIHTKGSLNSMELDLLKEYLSRTDASPKDTIFIKYDFNGETCWDHLDLQSDEYIDRVVLSAQMRTTATLKARPGISIHKFRENGNAFNKLKLRDSDIKIDSSGLIRQLLFKEKQTCGTSGIVLPSGEFILVKYDSHFDALSLSGKKMGEVLR